MRDDSRDGTDRDPAALLRAARAGDPTAWAAIVARHTAAIGAALADLRLQPADAADVVQTTWLRLHEHAGTIRDPERLPGWLATTARREALTLLRRAHREVASASAGEGLAADGPSPEEAALDAETRATVRAAARGLTDRQRLLVGELFAGPARSYEEVARRTGLPVGSIGPTRGRMVRALRRRLAAADRAA